jgi:hypothetical protein
MKKICGGYIRNTDLNVNTRLQLRSPKWERHRTWSNTNIPCSGDESSSIEETSGKLGHSCFFAFVRTVYTHLRAGMCNLQPTAPVHVALLTDHILSPFLGYYQPRPTRYLYCIYNINECLWQSLIPTVVYIKVLQVFVVEAIAFILVRCWVEL